MSAPASRWGWSLVFLSIACSCQEIGELDHSFTPTWSPQQISQRSFFYFARYINTLTCKMFTALVLDAFPWFGRDSVSPFFAPLEASHIRPCTRVFLFCWRVFVGRKPLPLLDFFLIFFYSQWQVVVHPWTIAFYQVMYGPRSRHSIDRCILSVGVRSNLECQIELT